MKISNLISRAIVIFGLLTMVAVPSVSAGSEHSDDKKDKKDKSDYHDDDRDKDDDHDKDDDRDEKCETRLLLILGGSHDHENHNDDEDCEVDPVVPDLTVVSPTIFALPATR